MKILNFLHKLIKPEVTIESRYPDKPESYELFNTIPPISTSSSEITYELSGRTIIFSLWNSQFIAGVESQLVVTFEDYEVLNSYSEHWYPCELFPIDNLPKVYNETELYFFRFPCVEVLNSKLLKYAYDEADESCSETKARHFKFISQHNYIDLISLSEPTYRWVNMEEIESARFRTQDDYYFYLKLGPEDSDKECNEIECRHKRILQSSKCRKHHFEMIRGYLPPENIDSLS